MGCPGQDFWAEAITTYQPGCCFWEQVGKRWQLLGLQEMMPLGKVGTLSGCLTGTLSSSDTARHDDNY